MLKSFGKVTVAAGGTPARAVANLSAGQQSKSNPLQSVQFQVLPANTGKVYIFAAGPNFAGTDDRTALAYCIGFLPAPANAMTGPFPSASFSLPNVPAGIDLSDLWIDVDVNGNGVVIAGTVG